MGFTYKYANVEATAGGSSGVTGRAYALVDTSATVTAVSEEIARSSGLRGNRMGQLRGARGALTGAWVSDATVEIMGTKLPIKLPVLIVPRNFLEEDAILGRDFVSQMLGKIDIRVFPTPNGMSCDACDNVITQCRCAMKPISSGAPPQQPGPGQPGQQGGNPVQGPPNQWFPNQTRAGPWGPGPWGKDPSR